MCSENKGADQLCSYCTADLRLCFCIDKNPVFSRRASIHVMHLSFSKDNSLSVLEDKKDETPSKRKLDFPRYD